MSASRVAELSVELATVSLETERTNLKAAKVAVEAAKLQLTLANLTRDHITTCTELQDLQDKHSSCETRGAADSAPSSSDDPPPPKKARETPPNDVEEAEERLAAARDLSEQAEQKLAAAGRRTKQLKKQITKRKEQITNLTVQLVDLQSVHRECLMVQGHPDEASWMDKSLWLTKEMMADAEDVEHFVRVLTKAPCLKVLKVHLRETYEPQLKLVLDNLPRAPARIKELVLHFGRRTKEIAFALLDKTRSHLERLELGSIEYPRADFTDEELCHLWRILDGSGVKRLSISMPELMRSVQFPFQASQLQVERLDLTGVSQSRYPFLAEECKHYRVLVPLLQAASSTLKVVQLPGTLREEERVPVFNALAQCVNLEEASVPCYEQLTQWRPCERLSLRCVRTSGLRSDRGQAANTAAAAKFLRLPSTNDRLRTLTLLYFEEGEEDVFTAMSSLTNLRILSFDTPLKVDLLESLLKALTCLEDLRLMGGSFMDPKVLERITPTLAPNLTRLEIECDGLEYYKYRECERAVLYLGKAFRKVKPNFNLCAQPSLYDGTW